ncbi:MAG: spore germination protein [Bacilli bacterium]|nr:spore germination protein [Bacilli bacterium]
MRRFLFSDIVDNVNHIKSTVCDDLLTTRFFSPPNNPKETFCVVYLRNMVEKQIVNEGIVFPIMLFYHNRSSNEPLSEVLKDNIIVSSHIKLTNLMEELFTGLLTGMTVLLLNKSSECLLIETNNRVIRSPQEPDNEKVLRGPRESFVESLDFNIQLIRRRIVSTDLHLDYQVIGKETKTRICLCYMKNLVSPELVPIVKARLSRINFDGILDTNIINEKIKDAKYTPFKTIGVTERPDVFAGKILEGKVGIIADGTPVALSMPYLFIDNFYSPDDYYLNVYFASFGRILRMIGFLVSVLTPALYIAISTHHWEIIPSPMALTIAHSQQDIPLPTILECIVMLIIFELIRETGLRTPIGIGQALSIVGAIVIGQAAVQARLVSSPMVIVISLTAITGLINTKLKGLVIVTRIFFLIMAFLLGLFGMALGVLLLIAHITGLKSFNVSYIANFWPLTKQNLKDSFTRMPKKNIYHQGEQEHG